MPDAPQKYSTDIEQAAGTVVGEHNTIYQYFREPENVGLAAKHIGFESLIADKTRGFVGRRFVFDAIDDFLAESPSGYFLVLGEPGIGKTAILAEVVKVHGYPHHFNVAPQNIRAPRQFLANACAQVIARYKLPHTSLPQDATEDSNFLVQCLQEAVADSRNRPVVLVVDALDESDRQSLAPRANLLFLPPALPDGAYVVASSRPLDKQRLTVSEKRELFLEPDSEGNLLDVRAYVDQFLHDNADALSRAAPTPAATTDLVDALVERSEGNFIYLRYVLPAVASGRFDDGPDALPQGLTDYYQDHWEQMQIAEPIEFDEVYAPVVCLLAVAREPLSTEQLVNFTGQDIARVRNAIGQWREFLEQSKSDGVDRFRLYHLSFQEFLSSAVDLGRFDKLISRYYLSLARGG